MQHMQRRAGALDRCRARRRLHDGGLHRRPRALRRDSRQRGQPSAAPGIGPTGTLVLNGGAPGRVFGPVAGILRTVVVNALVRERRRPAPCGTGTRTRQGRHRRGVRPAGARGEHRFMTARSPRWECFCQPGRQGLSARAVSSARSSRRPGSSTGTSCVPSSPRAPGLAGRMEPMWHAVEAPA
jgi:hypothetical protein